MTTRITKTAIALLVALLLGLGAGYNLAPTKIIQDTSARLRLAGGT